MKRQRDIQHQVKVSRKVVENYSAIEGKTYTITYYKASLGFGSKHHIELSEQYMKEIVTQLIEIGVKPYE